MTLATATPTTRGQNVRTAIAGEFFVAGELSKRGWIATLTSKNTPGFDILANQDDRFLRIDVKTRTSGFRYAWQVGGVHISDPGDFVVLVALGDKGESPEYPQTPQPGTPLLRANRLMGGTGLEPVTSCL